LSRVSIQADQLSQTDYTMCYLSRSCTVTGISAIYDFPLLFRWKLCLYPVPSPSDPEHIMFVVGMPQQSAIINFNLYTKFEVPCFTLSKYALKPQNLSRKPASRDRTARCQLQATGQSVSRTQASDTMTSQLPHYEAKCVQRRCFQCGLFPLRSDIKGKELPLANILIPLERQLIALQLCR